LRFDVLGQTVPRGVDGCFADANRSDMVELTDDALEAYAKTKGFELPPKR
jgi:hypothetical protein